MSSTAATCARAHATAQHGGERHRSMMDTRMENPPPLSLSLCFLSRTLIAVGGGGGGGGAYVVLVHVEGGIESSHVECVHVVVFAGDRQVEGLHGVPRHGVAPHRHDHLTDRGRCIAEHRTCARVVARESAQQQQQQQDQTTTTTATPATSVAGRHRVEMMVEGGGGVVQARTSWKARERSEASEASTSWSMGLNLTALTLSQPHSKVAVGEPRVSSHRRMTGPEVAKMGWLAL